MNHAEKFEDRKLDRRELLNMGRAALGASILSAVVGCRDTSSTAPLSENEQKAIAGRYKELAASNPGDNLYTILNRFTFKGQNDKEVNINALRDDNQNRFSTLVFGTGGCDIYCPNINGKLGKLGEVNKDLISYVISGEPEKDGKNAASRKALEDQIKAQGVKHKFVVLYPTDENGNLSNARASDITAEFHRIVNRRNPENHGTNIMIYGPHGVQIVKEPSSTSTADLISNAAPYLQGKQFPSH